MAAPSPTHSPSPQPSDPDDVDAKIMSAMGFSNFTANTARAPRSIRGRAGATTSGTYDQMGGGAALYEEACGADAYEHGQSRKRKRPHKGFQPEKVATGANGDALGYRRGEGESEHSDGVSLGAQMDGTALSRVKPGFDEMNVDTDEGGVQEGGSRGRGYGGVQEQQRPWSAEDARGLLVSPPRKTVTPDMGTTATGTTTMGTKEEMENTTTLHALKLKDAASDTGSPFSQDNTLHTILRRPNPEAPTFVPHTETPENVPGARTSLEKEKGVDMGEEEEDEDFYEDWIQDDETGSQFGLTKEQLQAYSRGVEDEEGTTYFRPSFVEDPWAHLR